MPETSDTRMIESKFFFMSLDPIHVGTGGYRLGRVDLPIARDPATHLPKIPGTSLSGMARAYAAILEGDNHAVDCAGQKNHCGKCAVCYTFGSLRGPNGNSPGKPEEKKAHSGMVSVFDAHVLLFPVYSMAGPVWVSTAFLLEAAGFRQVPQPQPDGAAFTSPQWQGKGLNLGWLLLETQGASPPAPPAEIEGRKAWEVVHNRLVVVEEVLFSQIVESNLEVRTSVSINPETGAADEGALFTYEAIPRAAWLVCDAVQDFYSSPAIGDNCGKGWKRPLDVLRAGLDMAEHLGVGGMGTRGFGRFRVLAQHEVPVSL